MLAAMLIATLRLLHIVLGALWVGTVVFTTFFLTPAVQDTGPDGGKVMAALVRRGVMTVLPLLALGTLLTGIWLYWRASAGFAPAYVATRSGLAFGLGGAAAIVAYAIGLTVMRPAMLRATALAQTHGPSAPEVQRLRARGAAAARVVATLLLAATAAMALARDV
jgi:hypothetical protein